MNMPTEAPQVTDEFAEPQYAMMEGANKLCHECGALLEPTTECPSCGLYWCRDHFHSEEHKSLESEFAFDKMYPNGY